MPLANGRGARLARRRRDEEPGDVRFMDNIPLSRVQKLIAGADVALLVFLVLDIATLSVMPTWLWLLSIFLLLHICLLTNNEI